jgi:hypothetical protein
MAAALLLVVSAFPSPRAQTPEPVLALGVFPHKAEYVVGEPVMLRARIQNWLSPQLLLYINSGFSSDSTQLRLFRDGVIGEVYRSNEELSIQSENQYLLGYAKSIRFGLTVLYDPQSDGGVLLNKPGEHQFLLEQEVSYLDTMRVSEGKKRLILSAVSPIIRVVEAEGRDKEAFDLLKSHPAAFADLNRQIASIGARGLFERVAREYSDTVYAPYCLHALAGLYRILAQTNAEAGAQAAVHLRKLIDNYPDYELLDLARVQLSETLYLDDRLSEAVRRTEDALAASIDNLFVYRRGPLMRNIRGLWGNMFNDLASICWELFEPTTQPEAYAQIGLEREMDQ